MQRPGARLTRSFQRLVILTVLWWVLADGAGWGLGIPVIIVASATSLLLGPPTVHWRVAFGVVFSPGQRTTTCGSCG
jgi:hypothetical protein